MGQAQSTSTAPLSTNSMPHQNPCQQPTRDFDLVCCNSAFPYTLTHLAHLLPDEIIHWPYTKPLSLGPILTPFLILLATNATPNEPSRIPTFNPYISLMQVKRSTPVSVTLQPDAAQIDIQQEHSEPRYFAILTPEDEEFRQSMGREAVKGQQIHVEVEKEEAERILRFPGSGGGNIGDGETWTKVEGVEKIWCDECQIWWEFRAWAREV